MGQAKTTTSAPEAVAWLLETLFDASPGWEHPSFDSLVGALTAAQASWRPGPGRRSIWELLRHMMHWRECTLARVRSQPMPDTENNWPRPPDAAASADLDTTWRADVERYGRLTTELIEAVRVLEADAAHPHPALAHLPLWMTAVGMQIHDSYHLGQIALLRAMQGLQPVE
jgi:hypothetical protein